MAAIDIFTNIIIKCKDSESVNNQISDEKLSGIKWKLFELITERCCDKKALVKKQAVTSLFKLIETDSVDLNKVTQIFDIALAKAKDTSVKVRANALQLINNLLPLKGKMLDIIYIFCS